MRQFCHSISRVLRYIYRLGLKIAIADVTIDKLNEVGKEVASIIGENNILVVPTDVSNLEQVVKLRDKVYEQWGEVSRRLRVLNRTL